MRILAAIVVYHPDLKRLQDNIDAVSSQVDEIALFNNGETKLSDVYPNITILDQQGTNIGVASALNALCDYAWSRGYEWILTLDQDSIVPAGMIDGFRPYLNKTDVALLCPAIHDRNYGSMSYDTGLDNTVDVVDACITSGSLLRLSAWSEIHGFWDELFIDMVDFDLCWSLQEAGFKIVRVNSLFLLHEIGQAQNVRLFGKDNVIYNHPPIRCYYMVRNTIAVGRKHHRRKQCFRWNLKRILLINLFEKDRLRKDKLIIKGLLDGVRNKL